MGHAQKEIGCRPVGQMKVSLTDGGGMRKHNADWEGLKLIMCISETVKE